MKGWKSGKCRMSGAMMVMIIIFISSGSSVFSAFQIPAPASSVFDTAPREKPAEPLGLMLFGSGLLVFSIFCRRAERNRLEKRTSKLLINMTWRQP